MEIYKIEYVKTTTKDVFIRTEIFYGNGFFISVYPVLLKDGEEYRFKVEEENITITRRFASSLDAEKSSLIDIVLEKTGLELVNI